MPQESFQERRGKPRIVSQASSAVLVDGRHNRNLPRRKRSKVGQIKPYDTRNKNNADHEEDVIDSATHLKKQMWQNMDVSEKNPIAAPIVKSSFAVRYPRSREPYLMEIEKEFTRFLQTYGVQLKINFNYHSSMEVHTTRKTWDPYAIIKARDMIRLIARCVPFENACAVMHDSNFSEIVEMAKTPVARNQGVTLKAIELLTKCYVMVGRRSVCIIGPFKGVNVVKRLVNKCLRNIHPIYELKRLMVEQELANNEDLKKESWDRLLPKFQRLKRGDGTSAFGKRGLTVNQIKSRANKKRAKHGKYTPWPPPPIPSKIDIALQSGAYWNKEWREQNLIRRTAAERKQIHENKVKMAQRKKRETLKQKFKTARRIQKEMRFVAPAEHSSTTLKMKLRQKDNQMHKLSHLKQNVKDHADRFKKRQDKQVSEFLL